MLKKINENFKQIGINIPEIYMPNESIDLEKWAVIACDQYTSQPDYWHDLENFVNDAPSTLNLILPEIYLEETNIEEKVNLINSTMLKFTKNNVLQNIDQCFVYIQRQINQKLFRHGLLISIDLEHYDFTKGAKSYIRSTEDTVIDRLPPRIRIRENASLELPHILMLIDDPKKSIIEPLANLTASLTKLYDFNLYKNNNIKGFKINDREILENIYNAIKHLAKIDTFNEKYNLKNIQDVLLLAVGDGNHSLAAAKSSWDIIKKSLTNEARENHPARYALVELINIHDDSLIFEPIHRIMENIDPQSFIDSFLEYYNSKNTKAENIIFDSLVQAEEYVKANASSSSCHYTIYKHLNNFGILKVSNPIHNLEVGTLQNFIDNYLKDNSTIKIDYIHGKNVLTKLTNKSCTIGFYLPPMDKNAFFKTVILDGSLPRKTFSMGEAEEKRYYLECKKII